MEKSKKVTAREIIEDPARVNARARFGVDNTLFCDAAGRRFIRIKTVGERVVVWDEGGPSDGYVPVERVNSRRGFMDEFDGVALVDHGLMNDNEWADGIAAYRFRAESAECPD